MAEGSRGQTPPRRRTLLELLRSGTVIRLETILLVGLVVLAVYLFPRVRSLEREGLLELSEAGFLAPVYLTLAYTLVAMLLLPAFPLDFAAGAHFGFWLGALWVQVAAGIASIAGYATGRFVLRRWLERLMQWKPRLHAVRRAVLHEGGRIVFLSRLSPIFSFSLLNVFYGAVGVPFRQYVLATFAGMLPGTALYVYAGMMAGDLSGAPGHPGRTPTQWVIELAGFAATVAVVVLVTRIAGKALNRTLQEQGEPTE